MKALVTFDTTDESGERIHTESVALAAMTDTGLRLTYVEDVSGEGARTRCTMLLTKRQLRVTRTGELNSDFVYEHGLTHHTSYGTLYGTLPVTLHTTRYRHEADGIDYEARLLAEKFAVQTVIGYTLVLGEDAPMEREVTVCVTSQNSET